MKLIHGFFALQIFLSRYRIDQVNLFPDSDGYVSKRFYSVIGFQRLREAVHKRKKGKGGFVDRTE
nr:unnamed protein product [Callosobruchus analis]